MSKRATPLPDSNGLIKNYRYCSNGREWEIDISYYTSKYNPRWPQYFTKSDGGDDPEEFEIGSNLSICR